MKLIILKYRYVMTLPPEIKMLAQLTVPVELREHTVPLLPMRSGASFSNTQSLAEYNLGPAESTLRNKSHAAF